MEVLLPLAILCFGIAMIILTTVATVGISVVVWQLGERLYRKHFED